MMAWLEYLLCSTVIASVIIFLKYPAPKLSLRLQAWKNKGNFIKSQSWQIFYIDEKGNGPNGSLVCLHGFPTCSFDWIKILPKLREEFSQIIMLDFLGFGFSDKPNYHEYTIEEQANIVEDLVEKLGSPNVHLLSHDYGDTVALELLARHNSKEPTISLKSLTLLNGGIFPETHHPRPVQKLLLMPVFGYIASHLYSYRMFCKGFGQVFGLHKPSKEDNEDFWACVRYKDGDKATVRVINFLRERKAYKARWVGALTQANVKVCMIYGPADPVNPPEFAKHFKETVPEHQLTVLGSEIGHYPQWEDPISVGEEITDFIKNVTSA